MPSLSVSVVRFINEHQPGFVECSLSDAHGHVHLFEEKAPVVSAENLSSTSAYPRSGHIECRVQEEWKESDGRYFVRVSTEEPFHIESTTGATEFVVSRLLLETVKPEDLAFIGGVNLSGLPCIAGPVLVAVAQASAGRTGTADCPYCGSRIDVEVRGNPASAWLHKCICGKCNGAFKGL
jgi:hypothetical protein